MMQVVEVEKVNYKGQPYTENGVRGMKYTAYCRYRGGRIAVHLWEFPGFKWGGSIDWLCIIPGYRDRHGRIKDICVSIEDRTHKKFYQLDFLTKLEFMVIVVKKKLNF